MYNKLFTKILDSSIWLAPDPVRLVWITLIAAMDEDGNAMFACADNLAARARVTLEQAEAAIKAFESPDSKSGDPDNDGIRIQRFPGGWHVLNAHKYRAMVTKAIIREQTRARTAKWRAKNSSDARVTLGDENVTPSEAVSEAVSKSPKTVKAASPPDWFADFREEYPRRAGDPNWRAAQRAGNARILEGHKPEEFIVGAKRYAIFCMATGKEGTEMVQQASRFLGPSKSFMLPWTAPARAETAMERIQRLNGGEHREVIEHDQE